MSALYKINYKSDFVLTINSDAGWAVPFCIKFWTGMPSHGYFAGFDGENYVNCRVGETPTQLLVMFDDHHMPIGELKMQIAYHTTIEEFPDREFDEVTNPVDVTVDIDGTEYQVMLDFTGESGAEIDFSMPSSGVMSVNGKIGYVTLNAEDVGAQPTIEDLATIRSGAAEGATAVQPAEMTAALATKQDTISDLATIRSGAAAGATAVQPATLQEGLATKQNVIEDLATIRSGAAAGATAVQPAALQEGLAGKQDVISDLATIRSGAAAGATAVQPAALQEGLAGKQDTISDLATIRSGAAAGATAVQPATLQEGLAGKQDTISDLATIRSGAAAGATAVQPAALTPIENDIDAIEGKIPSAASASNQLADKAFVNSALSSKADAADIPTALSQLSQDSTHRVVTDAEKSTWNGKQNAISDLSTIRSGAAAGATAVQPAAMNTALAEKQDTLTFDNAPTANSNNPVKSSGIKTALDAKQSTISTVNVTVDNNTGTPSGSASVSGSTLSLSFQNLKGATGATGATGPQGPQGERGLPGESGVTGDVSGFTVIQTIDPSATYGATDIAGAATVQATNQELTELGGELFDDNESSALITFNNIGYYKNGSIGSSNVYRYSDIIELKKGDQITGTSRGTQFDIITDASVEGSYTTILAGNATTTNPQSVDYVAPNDIDIIVSAWVDDISTFRIIQHEKIYKYGEAQNIHFDNTNSKINADNVQDAIDDFANSLFDEDTSNLNFANIGGYYYNGVLRTSNVYGYTNILSLEKGDRITGTSRGTQFDIITDASVEGSYTTILAGNATTTNPQSVDYVAPNDIDIIVSAWVDDMQSFYLTRAKEAYKYKDAQNIEYNNSESVLNADNVQGALDELSQTADNLSAISDDFFGIKGGNVSTTIKNDNVYVKYSTSGLETASNDLYYISNPIRLYAGQKVTIKTYGYGDVSFITKCDENGNYETGVENSFLNGIVHGSEYIKVFETIITADCYVLLSLPYLNTEVTATYVATGSIIIKDNLPNYNTRRRYSPCKSFGTQPAANGTDFAFNPETQGYNNLLVNIYEPLRTNNPNYITRTNIGKDASGAIDMYVYEFTPKYYQQHILLIAGVHGDEVDGVICLARIMQLITNADGSNDDLYFLRNNVRITVLPALNVWGISQHPNNRRNATNQEMQGWNWSPEPIEVTNFRTYLDGVYETISFGISMHTTVTDVYKDFYGVIKPHTHNVRTIYRVNDWLCRQYAKNGATVDDQYLGWLNWRNGDNMEIDYWYVHYGFIGSIMELSDIRWGALHSSEAITMGVTMWLNYIVQQVNDFYIPKKLIWDIPEEDYRESRE